MSAMTNYLELAMLDFYFNDVDFGKPVGLEVSWHTADPTDAGSVANEVDLTGAGRAAVTFNNSTARLVNNSNTVDIASAANPGTITHWGIHRSDLAQQMLAYATLDTPLVLAGGEPVRINPGGMVWTFPDTAQVLSDYTVNDWLSHVFGGTTGTRPTNWFASLHTNDPGATGALNEFTGGSYARQSVNWEAASADDPWSRVRNTASVTFTNLQSTPISWWGIFDAPTAGNFIARRNQADDAVTPGSNATAAAQSLVLRVG